NDALSERVVAAFSFSRFLSLRLPASPIHRELTCIAGEGQADRPAGVRASRWPSRCSRPSSARRELSRPPPPPPEAVIPRSTGPRTASANLLLLHLRATRRPFRARTARRLPARAPRQPPARRRIPSRPSPSLR